jgi:hypothetical protein
MVGIAGGVPNPEKPEEHVRLEMSSSPIKLELSNMTLLKKNQTELSSETRRDRQMHVSYRL